MTNKLERRAVQIRVTPNTDGPEQDGLPRQFWARVLNYEVVDDYGTKFRYGSATESLSRRLPRLMYGHSGWENPAALLGRGIDFRDSKEGLDILFEFDDFDFVPMGRQIAHQMSNDPDNPTLDQFSIGFIRQRDTRDNDGKTVITKMRLGETSVVVEGSVPGTKLLAFRSSADGGGASPFEEGAVMDANDAARIIARFSLGEVDLAQALDMVKSSVIIPDDEDKDDASTEDATEPDADSDPPPADPPQEDAGGDSQANDGTEEENATAEEPPASKPEPEPEPPAAEEEQVDEDEFDELLAEIDNDLADIELVARHVKPETRDFNGNQHAGSKTDVADVAGTLHVGRLGDTPDHDHMAWESKPAGSLVAVGGGESPARVLTSRTKMWKDGGWSPHLTFTTEVGGKVVGSTSSVEAAKKLAGDVVWTDR